MKSSPSTSESCGVCLAPGDSVNHLDHLAPLSFILDIPLVVDSELLKNVVETYYPQVKTHYLDHHAKILEYFAQNYEMLFVSSTNYRKDLTPLFEVVFRKKMGFWYCPHGHSDKSIESFEGQQFFFTYGPLMESRLKERGLLREGCYVRTGNYRLSFYEKHQAFYDDLVEKEIFSKFKQKQPTILYAPTWQDLESSSSFPDFGIQLPTQVPSGYNLIIKLHPWLMHYNPGYVVHLEERYHASPNIVVLSQYPLIYPILRRCDIYLGDCSSVGYDFLYYNRPMFFLDGSSWEKKERYSSYLRSCGTSIPPSSHHDIFSFIKTQRSCQEGLMKEREQVYEEAFGNAPSFEDIKGEVQDLLNQL